MLRKVALMQPSSLMGLNKLEVIVSNCFDGLLVVFCSIIVENWFSSENTTWKSSVTEEHFNVLFKRTLDRKYKFIENV